MAHGGEFVGMTRRGFACTIASLFSIMAPSACVLADPPATLPEVAEQPPFILTGSVVPSTSVSLLTTWPTSFVIPVFLLEPADLEWRAAVDYLPIQSEALELYPGATIPASENGQYGVTLVSIPIQEPVGPGCSTVTIVVAYGFSTSTSLAPDSRGGSSVTWRFAANGECQTYDASALATVKFPDGGGD